jgi:predicted RNase H-like nuclease (RuvC/YqgF family)
MADFAKFEDWQAPWEKSGEDFDEARAKGLIYSLSKDKHEASEKFAALKTERDDLKTKVDEVARKDETEVERLRREVQERDEKLQQRGNDDTNIEVLRLRVALKKGLSETQAKRLVGKTEEELEADADDLLASFGGSGSSGSDDDDDDDNGGRRQVRGRAKPFRNEGRSGMSPEDFASKYGRQ